MELNLLAGKHAVEATAQRRKMTLSGNHAQFIFQMFTDGLYKNSKGSIVREITSNCFDSHAEAGDIKTPVVIRLGHDKEINMHYISFIDFGVGMSPERIFDIYGTYFESTKRETNDQIGGFGIGGKTPLTYKRKTVEGEGDYDNSFYVITNYNGVKYYYCIVEGTECPEIIPLHEEKTTIPG